MTQPLASADIASHLGTEFGRVLAELVAAVPGALGAVLSDRDGHAVDFAVDPAHYGIDYELLRGREDAHGLVAVSASYLAGQPYKITWRGLPFEDVPGGVHSWLAGQEPVGRAGFSIYLYELP